MVCWTCWIKLVSQTSSIIRLQEQQSVPVASCVGLEQSLSLQAGTAPAPEAATPPNPAEASESIPGS